MNDETSYEDRKRSVIYNYIRKLPLWVQLVETTSTSSYKSQDSSSPFVAKTIWSGNILAEDSYLG